MSENEGVQSAYVPFGAWYINELIELINKIDGRYENDYLLKLTEKPTGAESYWKNRGFNGRLKQLVDSKNPIRWSGVRATFENYAGSSGMPEDIRFFIQGRTLKGSQAHYATTSSRLKIIHNYHAKAMDKFKSNLLARLLMVKAFVVGVDVEHDNTSPFEILGDLLDKAPKG